MATKASAFKMNDTYRVEGMAGFSASAATPMTGKPLLIGCQ